MSLEREQEDLIGLDDTAGFLLFTLMLPRRWPSSCFSKFFASSLIKLYFSCGFLIVLFGSKLVAVNFRYLRGSLNPTDVDDLSEAEGFFRTMVVAGVDLVLWLLASILCRADIVANLLWLMSRT